MHRFVWRLLYSQIQFDDVQADGIIHGWAYRFVTCTSILRALHTHTHTYTQFVKTNSITKSIYPRVHARVAITLSSCTPSFHHGMISSQGAWSCHTGHHTHTETCTRMFQPYSRHAIPSYDSWRNVCVYVWLWLWFSKWNSITTTPDQQHIHYSKVTWQLHARGVNSSQTLFYSSLQSHCKVPHSMRLQALNIVWISYNSMQFSHTTNKTDEKSRRRTRADNLYAVWICRYMCVRACVRVCVCVAWEFE